MATCGVAGAGWNRHQRRARAPAAERQKLRSHARIDFEVKRDPERPDNLIAKSCHTSIIAVRKARARLGIPPGP